MQAASPRSLLLGRVHAVSADQSQIKNDIVHDVALAQATQPRVLNASLSANFFPILEENTRQAHTTLGGPSRVAIMHSHEYFEKRDAVFDALLRLDEMRFAALVVDLPCAMQIGSCKYYAPPECDLLFLIKHHEADLLSLVAAMQRKVARACSQARAQHDPEDVAPNGVAWRDVGAHVLPYKRNECNVQTNVIATIVTAHMKRMAAAPEMSMSRGSTLHLKIEMRAFGIARVLVDVDLVGWHIICRDLDSVIQCVQRQGMPVTRDHIALAIVDTAPLEMVRCLLAESQASCVHAPIYVQRDKLCGITNNVLSKSKSTGLADGDTVLHVLAKQEFVEQWTIHVFNALVEHGASVNATNKEGQTAADRASSELRRHMDWRPPDGRQYVIHSACAKRKYGEAFA